MIRQAISILESEKARAQPQSETALNETGRNGSRGLSSSAAKPPPPHPILKKPRGPSSSGPRPTARFVSPHASEDEDEKDSEINSSGSTVTPALEIRPPVTSPPKKKVHGKKFVASTGAAKRRPHLPRKNSSQSSSTSEHGSKDGTSSSSSRGSGTPQRPVSPIVEGLPADTPSKPHGSPRLSAKAAGKRPMLARKTTAEKRETRSQSADTTTTQHKPNPNPNPHVATKTTPSPSSVPKPKRESLTKRPQSLVNLPRHAQTTTTSSSRSANGDEDMSAMQQRVGSVPMAQSRSHSDYIYPRESGPSRRLDQGLFTGATASTTNIAAQGMIIDQSGSFGQFPDSNFFDRHLNESSSAAQSLSSSLLESRFTPTQPSTSGSVPLGRTKSQLTLLLERENEARAANKPRSKS